MAYVGAGLKGQSLQGQGAGVSPKFAQGLTYVQKNITSAQIKALHTTPIEVVPAGGLGTINFIVAPVYTKFNYGGSNVFVAGAGQTVNLVYNSTSILLAGLTNANIVGTATIYSQTTSVNNGTIQPSNLENLPIILYNPVATEITGNAANDNTVTVSFFYYTVTIQ